jgi:hypothetical protein
LIADYRWQLTLFLALSVRQTPLQTALNSECRLPERRDVPDYCAEIIDGAFAIICCAFAGASGNLNTIKSNRFGAMRFASGRRLGQSRRRNHEREIDSGFNCSWSVIRGSVVIAGLGTS